MSLCDKLPPWWRSSLCSCRSSSSRSFLCVYQQRGARWESEQPDPDRRSALTTCCDVTNTMSEGFISRWTLSALFSTTTETPLSPTAPVESAPLNMKWIRGLLRYYIRMGDGERLSRRVSLWHVSAVSRWGSGAGLMWKAPIDDKVMAGEVVCNGWAAWGQNFSQ